MITNLIGYAIPKGRAIIRIEDREEWLKKIKELWKTVDYACEQVDIPDELSAEKLLDVAEKYIHEDDIIDRDALIETGMI